MLIGSSIPGRGERANRDGVLNLRPPVWSGFFARRECAQRFFVLLKSRVVNAYYTSEIGIRQELDYRGNVYQAEFSGVDVSREP